MKKIVMPILAIGLLTTAGYLWATRGADAMRAGGGIDAPYIDPVIGKAYVDFANKMAVDQSAAIAALNAANAKPDNGYTFYLRAALAAHNKDLKVASDQLERGNAAPDMIHYIVESPAHENQPSLTSLRRLTGFADTVIAKNPKEAPRYLRELRTAGYRVLALQPETTLTFAAGIALLNGVYDRGERYFAKESPEIAKQWKDDRVRLDAWMEDYKKKQSGMLGNVIRDVAKEAGLSAAETEDLAMRRPIADAAKQSKVDQIMADIVVRERKMLKDCLTKLPKPTGDKS